MKVWQTFAAALLAAGAVATVVVATGSATLGGGSSTHSFTLIEAAESASSFVDNEPKSSTDPNTEQGPEISQGDQFAFASEMFAKNRKHAGWLHAVCVATFSGKTFDKARYSCTGQFELRGGTIAVSGLLDVRRRVSRIAIVGGTGSYQGATGQIESASQSNGTSIDTVSFHT